MSSWLTAALCKATSCPRSLPPRTQGFRRPRRAPSSQAGRDWALRCWGSKPSAPESPRGGGGEGGEGGPGVGPQQEVRLPTEHQELEVEGAAPIPRLLG